MMREVKGTHSLQQEPQPGLGRWGLEGSAELWQRPFTPFPGHVPTAMASPQNPEGKGGRPKPTCAHWGAAGGSPPSAQEVNNGLFL